MRYRMIVAYDGTEFHGWQKQVHPEHRYLRTIQDVLEKAVVKVMRQPIVLTGASRTDSGVHAQGQVVTFDATNCINPDKLVLGFNSWLPNDVQVRHVDVVHDKFNPINHCTSKGYKYKLAHGCSNPLRKPLFDRRFFAFTAYALNIEKMQEAAEHFLGEHDFAGFTKLNHGRKTTVRRIDQCEVYATDDWRISIDVAGAGFLWNMVRIIAGTLLEVGRGYTNPESVPEIIASCDRRRAGKTMAAQGLSLEWVAFDDQLPNKLAISKKPC
ncbi:MAG TPA: tRNA pseudouridine(38-40) synthase TruA [Phycisphaerales bacterium]|nr:tRNA pseudouridine(38-40) synthase TruA [Phycisphaerales bacterium]HIB01527.1 tRNA pseudouridine(38-40) synthase TruA [Phycisphaerales bacterium]HIB49804.1 tRNA pseudouridine(38-40) synthase TruA [Phycisphaerales bacterium]HIN84745.1 tRNA pseudouridine(38-40) synthase TruA [Phycisphaerales bacterium]HIO19985.1 tRNA pseudouridine(38-40) synthase TruA [Phycisphaerales bacterium]